MRDLMTGKVRTDETKNLFDNLSKFKQKKAYNKRLVEEIEKEIKQFSKDLQELKRIKIKFYY